MSSFLFDKLHDGVERVLDLRQAQHALTATNLANADTPGFRARFIPFDRVLDGVMSEGSPDGLARTDARHVGATDVDPADPEIEEIEPTPWALDGNSVVGEREVVRLKENALIYSTLARGLSSRLAMLRFAASNGKPGG